MDDVSALPYEPYDVDRVTVHGRAGIDAILSEVLAQVDDVLHEQVRLRLLVDAVISLNADLSLDGILSGMAETAARLVDAKQAAIAVFTPAPERRLRTFVQRGMDDGQAEALATLSGETGLLDVLLDTASPVRLAHLLECADAAGVPRDRVPVDSFLGVAVRTRSEVFGVLYLADRLDDGDFTDLDETVVVALATAAGVAIDNARLRAQTTVRQRWLEGAAEAVSVLSGGEPDDARLAAVAAAARTASRADLTWIATGREVDSLRLHAVVGEIDGRPADDDLAAVDLSRTLVAEAVRTGAPVVVDDLADDPRPAVSQMSIGRAVAVPLRSEAGPEGAIGFGWQHDRDDALDDTAAPAVALVEVFTTQVALALQSTRARAEAQRLALVEDRGRIGADLQGSVIQRLFGVGLGLEAAARLTDRPAVSGRLADAVSELDAAIADLRHAVFDLSAGPGAGGAQAADEPEAP